MSALYDSKKPCSSLFGERTKKWLQGWWGSRQGRCAAHNTHDQEGLEQIHTVSQVQPGILPVGH